MSIDVKGIWSNIETKTHDSFIKGNLVEINILVLDKNDIEKYRDSIAKLVFLIVNDCAV